MSTTGRHIFGRLKNFLLVGLVSFCNLNYSERKDNCFASLPADVLWGSFVTHSFLKGRLREATALHRKQKLRREAGGRGGGIEHPKAPASIFSVPVPF